MTDFLIGLSGYARSGKDEAAQALVAGGWHQAAFADKLRDFLLALDPVLPSPRGGQPVRLSRIVNHRGWEYAKTYYPETRILLQRAGTEAGRSILGEDVWVNALFHDHSTTPALVITDVRFPNEAQAIIDRGGRVLRIERPGCGPAGALGGLVHESETVLDSWSFDGVIINDGSIANLHDKTLDAAVNI